MWCKVGPNFILWVPVLGARTMAFSVWHFHFRSWALGSEGQQAWVSWLVSRGAVGASVFSVALCPRQSPIPQVGAGLKKGAPTSAAFGELSLSNRWLLQDDKWPVPPRKITLQLELKGEGALYSQLHQVARVSLLLNQMKVGVVRVGRTSLGSNTTSSLFLLSSCCGWGLLSSRDAWASHCSDVSCGGLQALDLQASVVAACGL